VVFDDVNEESTGAVRFASWVSDNGEGSKTAAGVLKLAFFSAKAASARILGSKSASFNGNRPDGTVTLS